jgi:hypothetical protein
LCNSYRKNALSKTFKLGGNTLPAHFYA